MNAGAIALLAAGVSSAVTGLVLQQFQKEVNDRIYANQIASCERGNVLRDVVRGNIEIALGDTRSSEISAMFRRQLELLGPVDCLSVIQK